MSESHLNHHITGWVEKIQDNVSEFRSRGVVSDSERLDFILHQYQLVMLIYRALNGQVIFVGAKPIEIIE